MKTAVIIPVKSFSKSKSRLNLSPSNVEGLCKIMLDEILQVVTETKSIDDIILVSKDESAFGIGKKFDFPITNFEDWDNTKKENNKHNKKK